MLLSFILCVLAKENKSSPIIFNKTEQDLSPYLCKLPEVYRGYFVKIYMQRRFLCFSGSAKHGGQRTVGIFLNHKSFDLGKGWFTFTVAMPLSFILLGTVLSRIISNPHPNAIITWYKKNYNTFANPFVQDTPKQRPSR